jgi:hypothetical protein
MVSSFELLFELSVLLATTSLTPNSLADKQFFTLNSSTDASNNFDVAFEQETFVLRKVPIHEVRKYGSKKQKPARPSA